MNNLKMYCLEELDYNESKQLNGGWLGHALLAMTVFHIIKESVNDWDSQTDAFNRGREAAQ